MNEERPNLDTVDQYMTGTVPLQFVAKEVQEATEGRLKTLQLPWARHLIGAIEERLNVQGFRTATDGPADDALWRLWTDSGMTEASPLAHTEALGYGRSFGLVWADRSGRPVITVESARECAVIFDRATRSRRAGIKRWVEDERGHAVMFLPQKVIRFRTSSEVRDSGDGAPGSLEGAQWEQVETLPNPLGAVPLVPLVNRPSITNPYGRSELKDLQGLFDAMTKLQTDAMTTAESHASPRRWASGISLEEEADENGQPTGEVSTGHRFSSLPGRLWVSEDAQSRFGEFAGSDLVGYVNLLAMLKRDMSSLSSLPSHYLGLFGDQPSSADAIRAAEASLVSLVRQKAHGFATAWAEVIRLAHAVEVGYFDPALVRLEVIWGSFETRSEGQAMDAASKGVASGILDPDFAAERLLGLTPTEAERNKEARQIRTREAAAAQLVNATATQALNASGESR
ncbi:phage portal protein [Nocardioides ginsengisoli]|uniref:Phage portal protein n=1 Tax=Nocardioides ginsengisoli TaxID=363868 RepID=A0ABW3W1D1_9ACTN